MMDVDSLMRILGAHDLRLDRAQLQAALRDDAFAEWVGTNLHSDNLLTADELVLYTALDRAGHVDTLVADRDLAVVQGLDERHVRTAIAELDRSTAAIAAHTETLRKQHSALGKLSEHSARAASQRIELEERRRQAKESERKRVQSEIEEVAQMMEFRILDLEQQAKASGATVHQTVDGVLQGDDRLLTSLQKLGWELEPDDPEEDEAVKGLRGICMKLIKTSVETIRARLDRVYLEAINASEPDGQDNDDDESVSVEDIKAMQEEVESLYLEILPVAQMAIEQQHLEPALKSVSQDNTHKLGRSTAAVTYIQECLGYLLERSAKLTSRIETAQAHQSTCSAVLTAARKELAAPAFTGPKRHRGASVSSPAARPRANTTNTPLPARRRGSSMAPDDSAPIPALLRTLAISLPIADDSGAGAEPTDTGLAVSILTRALADRTHKADEVAHSTQKAFESSIATHLADAGGALQTLRDSVLVETSFGTDPASGLVDPGIEASLTVLSEEVSKISDSVTAAERDMDAGVLAVSERRDHFVKRWTAEE